MKICWDTIKNLYLTRSGIFRDKITKHKYIEKESCSFCGESFLAQPQSLSKYCSKSCDAKANNSSRKLGKKVRRRIPINKNYKKHKTIKIRSLFVRDVNGVKNPFYKRRHSIETREKMSKNHADFNGAKNPFYGKKHNEETKKTIIDKLRVKNTGIGNPMYGRKHLALEKNPNWKGGKCLEPYCRVWKDKEFRSMLLERDKDKFCWNPQCGNKGYKTSLHHINYNKKDCRPENVIKLCNSCNSIANFDRDWWESFYNIIMLKRFSSPKLQ